MGKASSSKKVQRAARAAGRPGARRNYAWPVAIGAVVIVGVVLVVLSFGGNKSASGLSPRVGEHWHAAYGVFDCDHYLSPLQTSPSDPHGLHTHGDGLMHMHPFDSTVAGKKATIAAFGSVSGLKVTDTSFSVNDGLTNVSRKNGDQCSGKPGHLELLTWTSPTDATPKVITKNIGAYSPRVDLSMWSLAFIADGTKVPVPPSTSQLANPTAAETGQTPTSTPGQTPTSTPGQTPTSTPSSTPSTQAPAPSSSTTATTAKP